MVNGTSGTATGEGGKKKTKKTAEPTQQQIETGEIKVKKTEPSALENLRANKELRTKLKLAPSDFAEIEKRGIAEQVLKDKKLPRDMDLSPAILKEFAREVEGFLARQKEQGLPSRFVNGELVNEQGERVDRFGNKITIQNVEQAESVGGINQVEEE